MSEQQQALDVPMSAHDDSVKTHALIAYALMVLGLFTGLFWLIGAIWAMVKKGDAAGSLFEDHYSNISKTFWWGLGLSIVGGLLTFVVIGYPLLVAVWIWSIYRIVKGLARLTSNKAYAG
ncbi:DUF4870 family protein [Ferrimonas balearica]|uniref:DUF4870 family protein n=1 Tax=Ferrimonas balearica TaxID=44012 RepID=UPI001C996736|nr:hypothetical protein [Ferrimonas balearica]MBY5991003.1 hypothetical protein [Ferrimonas balearica]